MCRKCGAIVGAGEDRCAVCGESVASNVVNKSAPVGDRETIKFARAVLNRPYKFTLIFLVVNLFVFFLMWESSGSSAQAPWLFPSEVLLAYGAKLNILIDQEGEWWRFITPMFVHAGLIHLMVNMYGLWIIGPYVERLYGSARFVVIWVLSGIAGVVGSYLTVVEPGTPLGAFSRFLFKARDLPSVGASGALFGLIGVLFIFGIKFRKELPQGFKRAFGTGLVPIIVLNLIIGYLGRGLIDNAAHLGGLASGALLATFIGYSRPGERAGVAIVWRVLQAAMLGLLAFSFFKVVQNFPARDSAPLMARNGQLDQREVDFVTYAKLMNDGQETLYTSLFEGDVGGVDNAVFALDNGPSLDSEADDLRDKLKALLLESKNLKRDDKGTENSEQQKLVVRLEAWKKQYAFWLKQAGRIYGLPAQAGPE